MGSVLRYDRKCDTNLKVHWRIKSWLLEAKHSIKMKIFLKKKKACWTVRQYQSSNIAVTAG